MIQRMMISLPECERHAHENGARSTRARKPPRPTAGFHQLPIEHFVGRDNVVDRESFDRDLTHFAGTLAVLVERLNGVIDAPSDALGRGVLQCYAIMAALLANS